MPIGEGPEVGKRAAVCTFTTYQFLHERQCTTSQSLTVLVLPLGRVCVFIYVFGDKSDSEKFAFSVDRYGQTFLRSDRR
jgi:hypothetical protein